MNSRLTAKSWVILLSGSLALFLGAPLAHASDPCPDGVSTAVGVCSGYDLFVTTPGTVFNSIPFVGDPLGSFNFGGSTGTQLVGDTDTIVQRLSTVSANGGSTALVIDALQLESAVPVTTGIGTQFLFADLMGAAGLLPQTDGTMAITWVAGGGSGTFNSSLPVEFGIHDGSLTGPIDTSINIPGVCVAGICTVDFTTTGTPWSNVAPAGAKLITGIDFDLNGTSGFNDLFAGLGAAAGTAPTSGFSEMAGASETHAVRTADAVPEPGTLALLGTVLTVLSLAGLRRRTAAVPDEQVKS